MGGGTLTEEEGTLGRMDRSLHWVPFMLGPHDGFLWATSGRRVTSGCTSRALLLVTCPPAAPSSCLRPQTLPQGVACCSPSPASCG